MSSISVFSSPELQATLLALRGFDRDLQKEIRQQTKAVAAPVWTKAVRENANTRLEQRVLADTARVQVSNQNVTLRSAAIGRALTGGLKPSDNWAGVEFGADRSKVRSYTQRSRNGKSYTVRRHVSAQLRPRNRTGHAVMPAAAETIPRLASLWVQTTLKTFYLALERR